MDKQTAKNLLVLVNDKKVLELLEQYSKARIELLRNQLENLPTHEEVLKTQGKIQELRRVFTLRDEVLRLAEGK